MDKDFKNCIKYTLAVIIAGSIPIFIYYGINHKWPKY